MINSSLNFYAIYVLFIEPVTRAEEDVMSVFIEKMMYGAKKGSFMKVTLGDKIYELRKKT